MNSNSINLFRYKSMSELSRKERELIQRKKTIMDVALGLFAEKGYHQTSMNTIAQKAEFSVGTLYNFFINKEELYKAMVNEKAAEFYEILMSVLGSEGSPEEIIKKWVDAKIQGNNKRTPKTESPSLFLRIYSPIPINRNKNGVQQTC